MIRSVFVLLLSAACVHGADPIRLPVTHRTESGKRVTEEATIDPKRTVIVVVDMWDAHWCETFTERVGVLVPRMNRTLAAARKLGIQVVFAPSDVVGFYKDAPQRKAMAEIAVVKPPTDRGGKIPPLSWCQSGGCECGPDRPCKEANVWKRQHKDVEIGADDLIIDCNNGGELYGLCRARKYDTLIYIGVASNMCITHRGCGLRPMRQAGLDTFLVADLTAAISGNGYDPDARKLNDSFTPAAGTAAVQRQLEAAGVWTFESRQLLAAVGDVTTDRRPHLVCVIADDEYDSAKTLPAFCKQHLKDFRVTTLTPDPKDANSIPGLDALPDADVVVLSVRRRFLPVTQMDHLERYIRAGKPLVVIRAGITPFAEGNDRKRSGSGRVVWQRFDRDVLGCDYQFYDPAARKSGSDIAVVAGAKDDPLLKGVSKDAFHTPAWIYRVRPLADTATPLLEGKWTGADKPEPVAWTNRPDAARVFYTSLGHADDFTNPAFNRLLENAVRWAAGTGADPKKPKTP
jgi:nicotinamidase-related amidase